MIRPPPEIGPPRPLPTGIIWSCVFLYFACEIETPFILFNSPGPNGHEDGGGVTSNISFRSSQALHTRSHTSGEVCLKWYFANSSKHTYLLQMVPEPTSALSYALFAKW